MALAAGRVKAIGKRTGEKLMPGKGNLPFLLSMLIGEACFTVVDE